MFRRRFMQIATCCPFVKFSGTKTDFMYASVDTPNPPRHAVFAYCDGVKIFSESGGPFALEADVRRGFVRAFFLAYPGGPRMERIYRGVVQILFVSPEARREYINLYGTKHLA
jgi:hypothetical protein